MSGFDCQADRKPTIACVGTLKSMADAVASKSGSGYMVQKYEVKGSHGSKDGKGNLLWMPAWFKRGFKQSELSRGCDEKTAKARQFVYGSNITSADKCSILQALCGGLDELGEMAAAAHALPDWDASTVSDFIKAHLRSLGPVPFGFILRQQRDKVEGEDADGNATVERVRMPYYEIDSFFNLTKKRLEGLVVRVGKVKERIAEAKADAEAALAAGEAPPEIPDEFKIAFSAEVFEAYGAEAPAEEAEPSWVAIPG